MKRIFRQQGLTLIELMISVSLGIVAVGAIMFFYTSGLVSSYGMLKASKLNQEISSLMDIMVSDIRRAGYGSLTNGADPSENIFSDEDTRLAIYSSGTDDEIGELNEDDGSADCIVYAYNQNYMDGNTLDNADFFGFRLSGGEIQMRINGNDNNDCADDNAGWESVTDSNEITINELSFSLENSECLGLSGNGNQYDCYAVDPVFGSGDRTVESRQVDIILTATLADDTEVSISLTETVRVRNDHVRVR